MSGDVKNPSNQSPEAVLTELLKNTGALKDHEKDFLISRIGKFDHLDKFKIKRFLMIDDQVAIKDTYKVIRDKFLKQEATSSSEVAIPGVTNVTDAARNIAKKMVTRDASGVPISASLLGNITYLGGVIPNPPQVKGKTLDSLEYFSSLDQLSQLDRNHVTFSLDENTAVILQSFLKKITSLFESIDDVTKKRGYFRLFMRSALFNAYLNTGITALRHTEIQPRKVVLNLIYQTDPTYLNAKQFEHTSTISAYLKALVDI